MVHCPAAVCAIYPVWQLPAIYPVIDEACTLVFPLMTIANMRDRYQLIIMAEMAVV